MARVQEIRPETDAGVYTVVTRTSTYLLDFTEMTLLRAPGVGGTDDEDWTVSRLRRDSEDIPLLGALLGLDDPARLQRVRSAAVADPGGAGSPCPLGGA